VVARLGGEDLRLESYANDREPGESVNGRAADVVLSRAASSGKRMLKRPRILSLRLAHVAPVLPPSYPFPSSEGIVALSIVSNPRGTSRDLGPEPSMLCMNPEAVIYHSASTCSASVYRPRNTTEMISTIQIMAVVLLSALSVDAQCRAAGCSGKRDMVPNPDRAIAVSELANRTDAAKAFVGKLVAEQRFKGGVSTGPKGKTLYDNNGTVVGEFSAGAR
jgi:hypothetical protein